ncbi:tyrosine-type recombinase/integrase [Paenibacillus hexagrammi]|uniref:Tyrosine-type recombinase/integrase n=1 Tax=Paenibacillus hexagrammi TaxID=2908839 RepID=A0ABY3SRS0_9BACL|nr:tyrosine-type recombinase/integrase [Paenibacillus sp. YPD9-1]UJF36572.1 tyrosine-type recombinase/integrase [Paenibacillus sp. YPD9-1]
MIEKYIAEALVGKSDSTIRSYKYALERFEKYLSGSDGAMDNLTQFDVQSYISWMQTVKKCQAASINREYAAIASFCEWSNQQKALIGVRLPKQVHPSRTAPKSLERNDRNNVFRAVQRDGNLRDIAIVYTLYFCGLRLDELLSLDRADVDLSDRKGELIVRSGKGDKQRTVPIDAKARAFLKEYLDSRNDDCEALFVATKGTVRRLGERWVQKTLKKYDIHPHLLRHTFARDLVDSGTDIVTVADLLGHSDLGTTMRYTRPSMEDKMKAVSGLGL